MPKDLFHHKIRRGFCCIEGDLLAVHIDRDYNGYWLVAPTPTPGHHRHALRVREHRCTCFPAVDYFRVWPWITRHGKRPRLDHAACMQVGEQRNCRDTHLTRYVINTGYPVINQINDHIEGRSDPADDR